MWGIFLQRKTVLVWIYDKIGKTRRAGGKLLPYSFKLKLAGLLRKRISFVLLCYSVFVLFCFFVLVLLTSLKWCVERVGRRVRITGKYLAFIVYFQKQPSRGVLSKRCSENIQPNYRRIPMPKWHFNKVALQLYWNHTLTWVFSCKFAAYFRTPFPKNTSVGLLLYFNHCKM